MERNQIKIAFFDLDGTLVKMGNQPISPLMLKTLQQLQQNGIKICIATGRPFFCLPDFNGLKFDAYLTFNASYCCTNNEVLYKNPIPSKDVQLIIENAQQIGRAVVLASANRLGANGTDSDIEDYFAISQGVVDIVPDFDTLQREEIYQLMIGCYPEDYPAILKGVTGAKITAWWTRAVDVIPANGGKGLGVQKVLEHFHLTKKEAMAFGDGTNDIEMLNAVGLAVAMGNATDDVKVCADAICDTVDQDGIYYFCKERKII